MWTRIWMGGVGVDMVPTEGVGVDMGAECVSTVSNPKVGAGTALQGAACAVDHGVDGSIDGSADAVVTAKIESPVATGAAGGTDDPVADDNASAVMAASTADDEDEEDPIAVRKKMNAMQDGAAVGSSNKKSEARAQRGSSEGHALLQQRQAGKGSSRSADDPQGLYAGWQAEYLRIVRSAMKAVDDRKTQQAREELLERRMIKPNSQITLRIVLHERGTTRDVLTPVTNSIRLAEFEKLVRARCEVPKATKIGLLWLDHIGETIALNSQAIFDVYVLSSWCVHPWVVHVQLEGKGSQQPIPLTETSRTLFDFYDVQVGRQVGR